MPRTTTVSRTELRPLDNYRNALSPLRRLYAATPAAEFGPLALKALRSEMIRMGWCRTHINKQIIRIKGVFKWAVENELAPPHVYQGLSAVAGLKAGRSDARESEPVKPVPVEVVAVLPYTSRQVAAMARLQLITGMRPGEVCAMRGMDLDTSGSLWLAGFSGLAKKFSRFGRVRNFDDEVPITGLMRTARHLLYQHVRMNDLLLRRIPRWLRSRPLFRVLRCRVGELVPKKVAEVYWDTYWWYAVLWLHRKRPESYIELPNRRIARLLPLQQWDWFGEIFWRWMPRKATDARIFTTWEEIARASSDACHYLSEALSRAIKPRLSNAHARPLGMAQDVHVICDPAVERPLTDRLQLIDRAAGKLMFDGKPLELSGSQTDIVMELLRNEGWVKGGQLKKTCAVSRPDRAIKDLSEDAPRLYELIESGPKGYRFRRPSIADVTPVASLA